jgi:hypothetical protein
MARLIGLTDDKKRDAQVALERAQRGVETRTVGPGGAAVKLERVVKTTDRTSYPRLLAAHGGDVDALARAIVDGDPEIDLEQTGRRLANPARVYLREDGTILYSARLLQVVFGADGAERSRADFVDVEATVGPEAAPLPWSGRLVDPAEAVHKFAFTRAMQLRHVNGLTRDFLHHIAETLEKAGKLLLVGAGPKGAQPLILTQNGAPFRGFLEGRTQGSAYRLVLHLSNLELKRPAAAPTASAAEGGR